MEVSTKPRQGWSSAALISRRSRLSIIWMCLFFLVVFLTYWLEMILAIVPSIYQASGIFSNWFA